MGYRERAILVVLYSPYDERWMKEDLINEVRELAASSGADNKAEVIARKDKPEAAYYIGKGKVEEVSRLVREHNADLVIFNEDLSPAQERNLEKETGVKVIDRTQLILDVFAQRAKSAEGKVQVELAQLEYLLPRLTGRGQMLSRLGAGIGTRGPGEQKLEVDRRRIQERILELKRKLRKIEERREILREKRRRNIIPTVALVGYTNSGKSTLINALTGAQQTVKDKLFSTLDPKLKKLTLPNNQSVLIADTVGFLHNLPHHLIESFKATLEEVIEANVLIHVLDASNPKVYELKDAVYEVLGQLNVMDKPIITVLNKIDKVNDKTIIDRFKKKIGDCISISALYGENLNELITILTSKFKNLRTFIRLLIPHRRLSLLDTIHTKGQVIKRQYKPEGVYIEAEVPILLAKTLKSYLYH